MLLILCTVVLFLGWNHFHQDKPKNEIRILVDRAPNTLDSSQAPDAWARKIIPLIQVDHYTAELPLKLEDFTLLPADPALPRLHFKTVRDEMARALVFLSAEADVLYDTLTLSRTSWIKRQGTQVLEAPGFNLSFIGFQVKDPILSQLKVRQALALSFPVDDWIRYKFFELVEKVPEAPKLDLIEAARLLDEAGYPRKEGGLRFTLRYLTTPVREGNEMAFLVREALGKVGVNVEIVPLETSLFYQRLKRGDFQIFGSRMLRNSESDSVADLLSERGARNYFHYAGLVENTFSWNEVKAQVLVDIPLVPLYVWKHAAVLSKRISVSDHTQTELDDSFRFLRTLSVQQ
ncbi:MAG: hypothetical protein H7333_06195 [Bdellovibrionales bacterium]|nr:hypothetical protein [Oligoflexia bacterium]